MASILFFIITIVYMLCMSPWPTFGSSVDDHQIYIVHVEEPDDAQLTPLNHQELQSYYTSFLSSVATTTTSSNDLNTAQDLIHSYRHVLHGFAAKLSTNDLKDLEKKEGFIAAFPERILSSHTTHSPSFLGLNQSINGLWSPSNYGKGVIIGILDTGISPDHPSFSDDSMPSPPAKWKGKFCQLLTNFTSCNNKIIGAQSFVSMDNKTALDGQGHGTHTSSTAAGSFVKGANVYGNAEGTASGIAPGAHLAIYKVCNELGCSESAILAGMEAAIEDGVDVLSISLGGQTDNFYQDVIAIGAFSAMQKGIFVSASAGNDGPYLYSLENDAPWILTVGASTMDRKLKATVMLGNNQQYDGESTYQPKNFSQTSLPLVYAGNCSSAESLKRKGIQGKTVVCEMGGVKIGQAVKEAGGAAMIVVNFEDWANTTSSIMKVIPAAHIGYADGLKIKAYINSTETPTAEILYGGTVIGDDRVPVVAAFSSRGPSLISPGILKPDILGPGVNILAAWPTSVENNPQSKSTFNIISGTSMSCPHLSGVAALLKSAHPDWSPAAIKSAIITTSYILNHAHNPIEDETFVPAEIFATGAGHVNPEAAKDPGLIYDISAEDYIPYLCGLNYTNQQVQLITNKKVECTKANSILEAQLNYPSFSLTFRGKSTQSQTYSRTVTNVGDPQSYYNVTVVSPNGIQVNVIPQELTFSETNQKKQYNVTFSRLASSPNNTAVKGFLKWCSSKQCVSSPIAVILV